MASSINVPLPSPRSKLSSNSRSPFHEAVSQDFSWYHIISVAFSDNLSERLSRAPGAATAATGGLDSDANINQRWAQLCKDRNISSAPLGPDDANFLLGGPVPVDLYPVAPISDGDISQHAPADGEKEGEETEQAEAFAPSPVSLHSPMSPLSPTEPSVPAPVLPPAPKRRRGPKPKARKSLPAPAITAAKRNLRRISDISDRQWAAKLAAELTPSSSSTQPVQPLRRSGRSSKPKPSSPSFLPPSNSRATREPEPEPTRRPRKPHTTTHRPSIILFYFTTLPRPNTNASRPSSLALSNPWFSFRSSSYKPHKRTLTSDNIVMICNRARVRRLAKEKNTASAPRQTIMPVKPWLSRNLRVMRQHMEKKGKRIDSTMDDIQHTEAAAGVSDLDAPASAAVTTDPPYETDETENIVRRTRSGRKRKRKTM
ncbi:hypothetical protein TWF694_007574 [Orbilia ellipsospora]|uniref:Uncharacterized protein n=1 Tax=Orbilia ellipsospora TaxID=2528407 RepID=A0AAV9XI60_9PEZI